LSRAEAAKVRQIEGPKEDAMRTCFVTASLVALLAGPLCCPAVAAESNSPLTTDAVDGLGGAQAPHARLAGLFSRGCLPGYTKGVAEVTHPAVGICCIRPKPVTGINVSRVVPILTLEWAASNGMDLVVFYNMGGDGCPDGFLEVRTYDLKQTLTDRAAFTIVVP
jgi:hypothetical protein